MIIAGVRPPGFDAARAERARRAADEARARQGITSDSRASDSEEETSAVQIAPRPPAD